MKTEIQISLLRIFSLIIVFAYHLRQNNEYINGGFIGVDIFFVISGFLIFKIINEKYSSLSFLNFIFNRINRLLPSFLIIGLSSFFLIKIFYLPSEVIQFNKSLAYSIIFSSNFYFYYLDDYMTISARYKPFLHTWSLAVEMQLYILIGFFYFQYAKNKNTIFIFFIFLLFFFSFSTLLFSDNIRANFYLPFTRAWEFISGGLIYHYLSYYKKSSMIISLKKHLFLNMFGWALVLVSPYLNAYQFNHPTLYVLPVIIGSIIILFTIESKFFSLHSSVVKFINYLSELTYVLYLVHYPIFALLFYKEQGLIAHLLSIPIIIIIAIIINIFIERPFRFGLSNYKNIKNTLIVKFIYQKKNLFKFQYFLLIILTFLYLVKDVSNNGLNSFKRDELSKGRKELISEAHEYFKKLDLYEKKILILGDSMADDLLTIFYINRTKYKNIKFRAIEFDDTCLEFLYDNNFNDKKVKDQNFYRKCDLKNLSKRKTLIEEYDPDIIIHAQAWVTKTSPYMRKVISEYFPSKINIIIMRQSFKRPLESYFETNELIFTDNKILLDARNIRNEDKNLSIFNDMLNKNVHLYYLSNLFCDQQFCQVGESDKYFYVDHIHWSKAGTIKFSDEISKRLKLNYEDY